MAEKKEGGEATVRTIHRVMRKMHSAVEMVRIVLKGLRGNGSRTPLETGHQRHRLQV